MMCMRNDFKTQIVLFFFFKLPCLKVMLHYSYHFKRYTTRNSITYWCCGIGFPLQNNFL